MKDPSVPRPVVRNTREPGLGTAAACAGESTHNHDDASGWSAQPGLASRSSGTSASDVSGARPLELVSLDAGTFAPDVMVNNYRRLINEFKIDVYIGGYQLNTGPEL